MAADEIPDNDRLLTLDAVDSTNNEAIRLARQGAESWTVVWAREQLSGRGTENNIWISPPGNLYCSFILNDKAVLPARHQLKFVVAVAIADCLNEFIPSSAAVSLKYPNDVLLNDRKVAGVLIESAESLGDEGDWLVFGVGINVASFPGEVSYPATSLHAAGCENVSVEDLFKSCHRHLRAWVGRWAGEGFEPVRSRWLGLAKGLGAPMEVQLATLRLSGSFEGIDDDGVLTLLSPVEGPQRIHSVGEVYFAGGDAQQVGLTRGQSPKS